MLWQHHHLLLCLYLQLVNLVLSLDPLILWWTPFVGTDSFVITCADKTCQVSENVSAENDPSIIVYYGSDFRPYDLPLPRKNVPWALLHEESPKNNPLLYSPRVSQIFNYSSTTSRHSNLPLTWHHLKSLKAVIDLHFFKNVSEKERFRKSENLALIVYIQSSCDAPSERDSYVAELMKYIRIDSYGKCLHNRDLPQHLQDPTSSMEDPEFYELISKYKFVIAFENAVAEDYITEKLWRPIELGVVPIYLGSPSVKDWLPNDNAAILISDFESPAVLATYINQLNSNDTAYNKHLIHKVKQHIGNKQLVDSFNSQQWDTENESFVDGFHCFLCNEAHKIEIAKSSQSQIYKKSVDPRVLTCSVPVNPVSQKSEPNSWWTEYFETSNLEAEVMCDFIEKNQKYSEDEFRSEVIKRLDRRKRMEEL